MSLDVDGYDLMIVQTPVYLDPSPSCMILEMVMQEEIDRTKELAPGTDENGVITLKTTLKKLVFKAGILQLIPTIRTGRQMQEVESEIQRLLHKGKDEGGRTVLEIIDYRRNEELSHKMREEQATVNKIQRSNKVFQRLEDGSRTTCLKHTSSHTKTPSHLNNMSPNLDG